MDCGMIACQHGGFWPFLFFACVHHSQMDCWVVRICHEDRQPLGNSADGSSGLWASTLLRVQEHSVSPYVPWCYIFSFFLSLNSVLEITTGHLKVRKALWLFNKDHLNASIFLTYFSNKQKWSVAIFNVDEVGWFFF